MQRGAKQFQTDGNEAYLENINADPITNKGIQLPACDRGVMFNNINLSLQLIFLVLHEK